MTVDATDSATGSGTAEGSTGEPAPTNLLLNGSFEDWAGGAPVAWIATDAFTVVERTDDAYEGSALLEVDAQAYGEMRQRADVADGIPAGSTVVVEMAYRRVSGDATSPGIDVYGVRSDEEIVPIPAIVTPTFSPEGWTVGGGSVTTEDPFIAVRININAGGLGPQTVQIDDVRMWVAQ